MSTRLLYKAFFGRRYAPIVGVTLAICGLYGGYLLWFICQRYLPGPDAAAWHLAFLIGWMLCSFLALGRIPDALFTNRRLCAVRWLPVPGTLLVRLTLGHLLLLQGGIIALVFWGFFLHAEGGRASLLRLMLACLLCAALADLVIYLLALLASRVLSARTLGYGFIVLQYGGFFLLALLSARTVLRLPDFSNLSCAAALKAFGALLLLCAALSHAATARWYERGVAKAQQFQRQHRLHTAAPSSIRHPYLLLEWKRVLRNKELVFYTTIKNLVTIALLVSLFHQRVQLLLPDATLLTLVLLSVSCAINTIASTAYSSDASRRCYAFLPIDGARLFLWKTLVAAFWGLPLVVLVWLVSVCVVRPAFAESLLLLLYALTSALLCAALSTFIGDCSLGMQQKLVLAAAFLSGANNLILDEPFNGLDPASAIALKNQLRAHRDAGGLILLSTHNLDFVSNFCDTILFIDRSHRLITQPNPHDLSSLEAAFFRHASA